MSGAQGGSVEPSHRADEQDDKAVVHVKNAAACGLDALCMPLEVRSGWRRQGDHAI